MLLEDRRQQARLQNLIEHPDFEILVKFAEELKRKLGTAPVMNVTEWDFLKASLQKEYRMSFIDEFFKLIEQEAYEGPEPDDE